jgi:hypothetical protein
MKGLIIMLFAVIIAASCSPVENAQGDLTYCKLVDKKTVYRLSKEVRVFIWENPRGLKIETQNTPDYPIGTVLPLIQIRK